MRRVHLGYHTYRAAVMALNPVGYWRLGESAGTVAKDEMGLNHGTYVNTPTLGAVAALAGDPDTAAGFASASSAHVTVSAVRLLGGMTDFSIFSWVSLVSVAAGGGTIYCERGFGYNDIVRLNAVATTGRPSFVYRDTAGTLDVLTASSGSYVANGWHLLGMTKQGSAVTFYGDGAPIGTGVLTATDTLTGVAPVRLASDRTDPAIYLNGSLDEPAIFARALTASEIARLHQIGRGF